MSTSDGARDASLISESATVNEILARYPSAIVVLNAFGVDTCCGGEMPLRDAALHARVDLGTLLAGLETAAGGPPRGAA